MFDYKLFKISTLCLGRNTKDWKKTNIGENTPNLTLKANWMKRCMVRRGFDLWRKCIWGLSAEGLQNVFNVKVGEVLVGIPFALVKATFWGLFSVVWVAMFYVLIVNVHSVLYFYAQTWWDSDLHLKTKHWESLGSYSKPFICSMRWITQTSLIVMTIKVNWLRQESV